MKVTLIYDNTAYNKDLMPDHGFSCCVEIENGAQILFDTGTHGTILLDNMQRLGIDPVGIDIVVLSHAHRDHTGGLRDLLQVNRTASVYFPASFQPSITNRNVVEVKNDVEITGGVFSTGELMGVEQSLVVKTEAGLIAITGCSHPGVGRILEAASSRGRLSGLIGGLHGFREFDLLEDLDFVCPCHCTQYKSEIQKRYTAKYLDGGAGKVIEF